MLQTGAARSHCNGIGCGAGATVANGPSRLHRLQSPHHCITEATARPVLVQMSAGVGPVSLGSDVGGVSPSVPCLPRPVRQPVDVERLERRADVVAAAVGELRSCSRCGGAANAASYALSVARVAWCALYNACCMLRAVQCVLHAVRWITRVACCALYNACCMLRAV